MTNILMPNFNCAAHYIIPLPASFALEQTFSPQTMDRFKAEAIAPLPYMGTEDLSNDMIYAKFVDHVAGRLKSFLKDNNEKHDISLLLDDSATAYAMLKFASSTQTVDRLKDSLEQIFGDLTLSDNALKNGSSWSKLPIDKIHPLTGLLMFPKP